MQVRAYYMYYTEIIINIIIIVIIIIVIIIIIRCQAYVLNVCYDGPLGTAAASVIGQLLILIIIALRSKELRPATRWTIIV